MYAVYAGKGSKAREIVTGTKSRPEMGHLVFLASPAITDQSSPALTHKIVVVVRPRGLAIRKRITM